MCIRDRLESERAGHFGHCDCFTVVEIADGEITGTSEVANPPHEEGGCMRPVGLLAKAGVDAIVAAGMGCLLYTSISERLQRILKKVLDRKETIQ